MSDATLVVDQNGRILAWSDEAEEMLGYPASEAVGRSIEFIMPPRLRDAHGTGFARFVQTGRSTLPEVTTTTAVHKNGEQRKLYISVRAVRDARGEIVAVQAMMKT